MNSSEGALTVHSSSAGGRNRDLQWLRAIAAFSVTLFHAANSMAVHLDYDLYRDYVGPAFGLVAVSIFFAITGALMADILRKSDPHDFLLHRIVRLYPIFILTTLALPSILDARPAFDARAILLVPNGMNATLRLGGVEWTLVSEVFFYVVLYLIALTRLRRHIEWFAAAWLAWIGLVALAGWAVPNMVQPIPFLTAMPFQTTATAFAAGLLIPALARRQFFAPSLTPLTIGLVLIGALLSIPYFAVFAGVAAFLIVGMAVQNGSQGKGRSVLGRSMTKLGDWSYALYLCNHPIQIWLYTTVAPRFEFSPPVLLALALILPLLLSIPLGILDVRLYRSLRQRVDAASVQRKRGYATAFIVFYFVASAGFILKEMF